MIHSGAERLATRSDPQRLSANHSWGQMRCVLALFILAAPATPSRRQQPPRAEPGRLVNEATTIEDAPRRRDCSRR